MKEILKNAQKYKVSKEKNTQITNELNILRNSKPTPFLGDYFISLTNMIMGNYKKVGALVVALGLVAVVGLSGVLQGQTAYASHLENAEKALQELQVLQNEGADANQERVRELVQEVLEETNAALALAEGEEGEKLQEALMEVKAVQEQSMSMFKNFEGDSVDEALQTAQQTHERVQKMLGEQSGEMVQEKKQEQNHLGNAEKAMEQLQVMQNEGENADPARVRSLAQEVVQETESALNLAEQKQEGEEKQKALQEVQMVQEKSMNMFKSFEGEGNKAVGEALQNAEQLHERTREMLGEQTGEMIQAQNKTQQGQ